MTPPLDLQLWDAAQNLQISVWILFAFRWGRRRRTGIIRVPV